jgi:hypothetical protein
MLMDPKYVVVSISRYFLPNLVIIAIFTLKKMREY